MSTGPRVASAFAGAVAIVLAMTACGSEELRAQDLGSAKQTAQRQQEAIVALLPQELIVSVETSDTGVLLPCASGGDLQWTGRAIAALSSLSDLEAVLADVAAAFEDQGFSARWDETIAGAPRLQLFGAEGDSYLVSPSVNDLSIDVVSASPCFPDAEGEYPGQVV